MDGSTFLPCGPVGPVFVLPDGGLCLQFIDDAAARRERRIPVAGKNANHHTCFPEGNPADAVANGDREAVVCFGGAACHALNDGTGERFVSFIFQRNQIAKLGVCLCSCAAEKDAFRADPDGLPDAIRLGLIGTNRATDKSDVNRARHREMIARGPIEARFQRVQFVMGPARRYKLRIWKE